MADPDEQELREALTELDNQLTSLRFTGRSHDRTVSAVVDGRCALRDLVIDETAMRGRFPEQIGQSITQAVLDARQQAGEESTKLLEQTLDPECSAAGRTTTNAAAAPGNREIDDFEQVDFIRPESDQ